ncbi:carboxylesterase family protein [Polyangium aurulentum]|nr:carboxylesterase family protein [Polyangium aurulentum]
MNATSLPIINTAEGPVQGTLAESGVVAYMGIPYAAPPVKNLRWRPPQAVTPWTETRASKADAPSCLQNRQQCILVGGGDPGLMDEDCLYLNVWVPEGATDTSKLPVMVWIHGGAYIIGAGRLPVYHGAPLVKKGAILVSFNYRMGALGFFAHPALDKERIAEGAPHVNNFGLLDQIAALEWVQRNIGKFGGDPDNVTIFGQSAGARSVLALYASPLVLKRRDKPLFHRGIAQSVYRFPEATQAQALARGEKLVGLLGVKGDEVPAQHLRDLPAWVLLNMDGTLTAQQLKGTSNSPVAISGDSVLPNGVIASFLNGPVAELPLIIGNTSDDGSVVLDVPGIEPGTIVLVAVGQVEKPKYQYPDLATQDSNIIRPELGRRLARDAVFTVTTYNIAKAHSQRATTWRYYFDYNAENLPEEHKKGTRHGDEVPFTMNTLAYYPPFPPGKPGEPVEVTEKDREVASLANEYWFNFAATGTPSSATGPAWPSHTDGQDKTLVLRESATVETNFMQEHHEAAEMENMAAFDKIGGAMDNIMS